MCVFQVKTDILTQIIGGIDMKMTLNEKGKITRYSDILSVADLHNRYMVVFKNPIKNPQVTIMKDENTTFTMLSR